MHVREARRAVRKGRVIRHSASPTKKQAGDFRRGQPQRQGKHHQRQSECTDCAAQHPKGVEQPQPVITKLTGGVSSDVSLGGPVDQRAEVERDHSRKREEEKVRSPHEAVFGRIALAHDGSPSQTGQDGDVFGRNTGGDEPAPPRGDQVGDLRGRKLAMAFGGQTDPDHCDPAILEGLALGNRQFHLTGKQTVEIGKLRRRLKAVADDPVLPAQRAFDIAEQELVDDVGGALPLIRVVGQSGDVIEQPLRCRLRPVLPVQSHLSSNIVAGVARSDIADHDTIPEHWPLLQEIAGDPLSGLGAQSLVTCRTTGGEIGSAVFEHNAHKPQPVKGISRATLFNYLAEFDRAFPQGIINDAFESALEFAEENPKTVRKFHRQFNAVTFAALFRFLHENDYLENKPTVCEAANPSDTLHDALIDFLNSHSSSAADQIRLPGHYAVYRPSLSEPGKLVASCAEMSLGPTGAIRYREKMHFKGSLGWRTQLFEGFCVSSQGSYFLLTKDSGTRLMQSSVLHVLHEMPDRDGMSVILMMAGSYCGITTSRPSNLFYTGLFLQRRDFGKLESHDLFHWKSGLMGGFGLLDLQDVPDTIRSRMIDATLWR